MSNELAKPSSDLMTALKTSVYPGVSDESINLILSYCRAANLDPLLKPVHAVPMWDKKSGSMRDVIMPGIQLYRIQAERSGKYAGISEPEFGPDVTEVLGSVEITYPRWCKVTVKKILPNGSIAEFTAMEFWKENYAKQGGKDKDISPNAMWLKRPYGQLAKCTKAQAFRDTFPEMCANITAEEAEGKPLYVEDILQEDELISKDEASVINKLIVETETNEAKFLAHIGSDSVDRMKKNYYITAINLLEGKKRTAVKTKVQAQVDKLKELQAKNANE